MRTVTLSTLICLAAPTATTAFHPTQSSSPTSTRLHARREYSELDKLTAKRLGMRRPQFEPPVRAYQEDEEEYERPLEYFYDESDVREDDAPFHILLMPTTFDDTRTSIDDVASTCVRILGMPYEHAHQLSMFAKYESFSVLGTWTRKECHEIGEQLREMNVDCRLVPHEDWLDEWECPEMSWDEGGDDDGQDIEAELSSFMEMQRAHDHDLEAFMNKSKCEQIDGHPDTFSLSS